MALILAIEPDRRQSAQVTSIVRSRLHAELVLAESAERALAALGDRVPDLVLTSALLSPKDETELGERLRSLDGAAAHVQTLTIPMFATSRPRSKVARGILSILRREPPTAEVAEGCDPAVFADQCEAYLNRAESERAQLAAMHEALQDYEPPTVEMPTIQMPFVQLPPPADPVIAEFSHALAAQTAVPDFEVVPPAEEDGWGDEPFTIELDLSRLVDAIAMHSVGVDGRPPEQIPPAPIAQAETLSPIAQASPVLPPLAMSSIDDVPITPPPVRRMGPPRPTQDEWGFFDPDQCGIPALIARLEELTRPA